MKKIILNAIIVIGIILLVVSLISYTFLSLNKKVENKNLTLNQFELNNNTYNKALADEINNLGKGNLEYIFKKYIQKDNKEYIIVQVLGKDLNAKLPLEVKNWNDLKEIKRTKGKSYSGAKLVGLEYTINNSNNQIQFNYKSLNELLD